MSKNTSIYPDKQFVHTLPLPSFASIKDAENHFKSIPCAWENYLLLPQDMQQNLINFCLGKQGLKITYDSVFQKVFHPKREQGLKRLESLLSAILGHNIKILQIIPREGTQMKEGTSFVVMDILVHLDDGSYANVEMQKIGYSFPLARADCYISDIIMRQYADKKATLGKKFTFNALQKVYSIIIMEQSPSEFHSVAEKYIHRRRTYFDTGIYPQNSGLHEDIFICLDSFHSAVHNITKNSNVLDAWLTFLSTTSPTDIHMLIKSFPCFATIYQEITDFVNKPKELIDMLSEELYIMDRNLERLMIEEAQEELSRTNTELNAMRTELDTAKTELDTTKTELSTTKTERDIFKLHSKNKTQQEIADELRISVEYVRNVLAD